MATTTRAPKINEMIPAKTDVGALGNRINDETRAAHDKIDKMVTVKFALAMRDYKIYRQGLQAFYHVFHAIEDALDNQFTKDDEWTPLIQSVWRPEVARGKKAQQDLLFYYDDKMEKFATPIMPEQIKFAAHIREVCDAKPYLLFAYMHVMYLALFAGGRLMRSTFAKATGLYPQRKGLTHADIVKMGANFFTFDVPNENELRFEYKREYELATRNNLTEEQKQEIIDESKYIFEQNARVVQELEAHNMARLKQKWQYQAITKGYYVVLTSLVFVVFLYLRKVVVGLF
ncbi:heme-binding protein Hmx1p [Diutina catenulata]